jgi:glycosyltransferase involved in cell wall biosynthesis
MRILIVLTYYRPHTSGLTIYTERLAKALARRGHDVTVLTSHFDPKSKKEEVVDGVRIIRFPVWFRISKGVISPTIGLMATRLVRQTDVIHLHLPQFDAAGIAFRGKLFNKPSVITYHCDVQLPSGLFNRFVNFVVNIANHLAGQFTDRIVTYTRDYGEHSPYARRYLKKLSIIQPPVELPDGTDEEAREFESGHQLAGKHPVIAMAARFAAEKGVEVLLDALPIVLEKYPNATVLFAGQYQDVLGEEAYAERLFPRIQKFEDEGHWKWLGVLNQREMASFYKNIDVLVVPSLNSTESFGLVQIEAMMNGVPVVSSNLPGVRQPVKMTGMGEVTPIGDSKALAEALIRILDHPEAYKKEAGPIIEKFSPDEVARIYEGLFQQLLDQKSLNQAKDV